MRSVYLLQDMTHGFVGRGDRADSGTESGGRVVGKGEDQGLQEQTGLVLFHVQKGRQVVVAEVNGHAHLVHVVLQI